MKFLFEGCGVPYEFAGLTTPANVTQNPEILAPWLRVEALAGFLSRVMALTAVVILPLLASPAAAQPHQTSIDGVTLQSSVVASTAIAESTAAAHGITRSPLDGVLNVVVTRRDGDVRETLPAEVSAQIRDLAGISHSVDLQPVRNGDRLSYVAGFRHEPGEVLDFEITARASGIDKPLVLRFRERMFQRKP